MVAEHIALFIAEALKLFFDEFSIMNSWYPRGMPRIYTLYLAYREGVEFSSSSGWERMYVGRLDSEIDVGLDAIVRTNPLSGIDGVNAVWSREPLPLTLSLYAAMNSPGEVMCCWTSLRGRRVPKAWRSVAAVHPW
jgi:hypothetical protein